jgi:predicted transcriptional regulator
MRRSKVEMYVDILDVLAQRGPLKLTHIMYGVNVNCSVLKEYIDYLTKQGLVEMKIVGKERAAYAISQLGLTVLKQFKALKEVLPIVDEKEKETRNHEPFCPSY